MLLVAALAAGGCRGDGEAAVEGPEGPPNVLVLLVDTLRADHLGAYGYPRPTSPHFDALAAESFLFEEARAQAPCTFPSVNSILTGRFPTAFHAQPGGRIGIPEEIPTLAEILKRAGYATAAVSASPVVRATPGGANPHGGFGAGFDTFDEGCLWHDASCVATKGLEVADRLREPFFLYLHFMDPHGPYRPPEDWTRRFTPEAYDGPGWADRGDPLPLADALYKRDDRSLATPEALTRLRDLYDEEIAYFDHRLGELLGGLGARGLLERSILVILADHGEEFYEHGHVKHCHTLYDTEVHTPLLLALPRHLERQAPRRIAEAAANLDLVPTLLDYAGVATDAVFAGRSLRGTIAGEVPVEGETASPAEPDVVAAWGGRRSLTRGRFKLIHRLRDGALELYDLEADPGETVSLVESHRRQLRPLVRSLARWIAVVDAEGRGAARDDAALERLRALGYLE